MNASTVAGTEVESSSESVEETERAARARMVASVVFLGMFAFVLGHYVLAAYLRRSYPETTFLQPPGDGLNWDRQPSFLSHYWSSLWQTWSQSGSASPYIAPQAPNPSTYPPFMHALLWVPSQLSFVRVLVLGLAAQIVLLPAVIYLVCGTVDRVLRLRLAFVLGICSYPALFVLDTGNAEALVFAVVVGFLLLHRRNPLVAAVLLGVAVALKGLPVVFVAIQLAERRFREAAVSLGVAAVLTAGSLVTFAGGASTNLRAFRAALSSFVKGASTDDALRHTSDLVGMLLVLGRNQSWTSPLVRHGQLATVLLLAGAALAVLVLRPSLEAGASLLAVSLVIGVHPSVDYRLIYLLVPIVVFVRDGWSFGDDRWTAVLWGLTLTPLSLPVLTGGIGPGAVVRPLLLLALFGLLAVGVVRDRGTGVRLSRQAAVAAAVPPS